MELEGMKRCLARLQESSVEIEAVVTDRHKQIAKWLREEKGNVTHYTDIWHCAKGNRKKWEAAAKLKGCTEIGPWIRSEVKFEESNWVEPYIMLNTNLRQNAKNSFEKHF
ncbi:hypothetical protein CAPTEDRAFT_208318 [Capitella teleta]|uniref:MULE transposase domain-containing protein n=1 Tax=Capitella teleta TaxID=283909 RepID=R7U9D4_CAPTE|nr:hypothetical protein CAPTEDRAFT_208318 [Capitella teleta]|eukprot:ELU02756.1 hypothetical protein CAPTEDRAFT_208318 [Capitella teleta]